MDTNVINLFKSTPAANDSGFLERAYPTVHHPANQITIEQNLLSISVSDLSRGLMQAEAARVQRKEIGRPTWQVMGNRLRAHIVPLLGDVQAKLFATADAQRLIDHLGEQGFTSTTIAQYLVLLRKVVMHGVHTGVLLAAPAFPKVKVRSQPRGSFSVAEYRTIIGTARSLRGHAHPVLDELSAGERFWIARELLVMPDELPWLIRWMVNTFVRPSDIKLMKHKHIEVVRSKHVYLRMNLPETKRHSQPIVSLRPAVRVYECLLAYRREHGHGEPDDYIFMPHLKNREHALAVLNFFFHWVLEKAGLAKGPLGQSRTLYCLRHTAITLRLLYGQGIDMLTLARNARTSVNMVERFYASVLSGEMNVGLLQSRRGRLS
jgi:integrase